MPMVAVGFEEMDPPSVTVVLEVEHDTGPG